MKFRNLWNPSWALVWFVWAVALTLVLCRPARAEPPPVKTPPAVKGFVYSGVTWPVSTPEPAALFAASTCVGGSCSAPGSAALGIGAVRGFAGTTRPLFRAGIFRRR